MPGTKRPRSPPQAPPSTAAPADVVEGGSSTAGSSGAGVVGAVAELQRRPKARPLEVHIVEDHGDVLEHLYDAIGAKRVPFRGLRWVHLDSHPDLTLPPNLRPATVTDPPALYAALEESPGGNAEFILPAVFAGHVREIWWIRPPWADQLPDGDRTFDVGVEAASGCLRVTCPDLYYLDEGLHCAHDGLDRRHPHKSVRLRVCTAEEVINRHDEPGAGRPIDSWILDVCLDYYTTRNPFLDALGEALRAEGGWGEPEVAAARATVRDFYDGPRSGWSQCGRGLSSVKEEMATFNRLTARLLDQADDTATTATTATASHTPPPPLLADADMATLRGLFTAPSRIDAFAQLLLKGGRPVVGAVRGMGGHCACLPAHAIEWVEVERMLEETAALVRQLCRDFGAPPSLVLVARSARDGYTPEEMVDRIQERLLAALERIPELTAAGAGEGLRVLRHYEEEVEEEDDSR